MSPAEQPFDTGHRLEDLDPEHPPPIETPFGTFALFRQGDEVHALEAFCPHLWGPLFAGSIANGAVTCPWHGWRYKLCDGQRIDAESPAEGEEARPLLQAQVSLSSTGTVLLLPPLGQQAPRNDSGPSAWKPPESPGQSEPQTGGKGSGPSC